VPSRIDILRGRKKTMIGIARVMAVSVLALLLLSAGTGKAVAQDGTDTASQPLIGTAAPAFELKTVAGDTQSLDDLRGRYVVLHFGASW
jgi:cytochrome oxidase Cu insertion factor (SCO1/SenC/PrrC family)